VSGRSLRAFYPHRTGFGWTLTSLHEAHTTTPPPATPTSHTHTHTPTHTHTHTHPAPPSQDSITESPHCAAYGKPLPLEPDLLTHLTRLTRLCISRFDASEVNAIRVPNHPAALPSAGGSLRALELAHDYAELDPQQARASLQALLPVAPGLESLVIGDSCLAPADAARLAAALPRDMAWLHINPRNDSAWPLLPVTSLELDRAPADLALRLAGASRLERLIVGSAHGVPPAALAAALQALPRLRALQLGTEHTMFYAHPPAAPPGVASESSAAFVAAVASLPSLQHLSLAGFSIGGEAKAALLEAAPRLSALRLAACGLSLEAARRLAAQLRAAAGRGALSTVQHPHDSRRPHGGGPIDMMAPPLEICAGDLP
jgi:hypothetical protein